MQSFQGRTAFITGASSGIGRCLAIQLAEAGCNLCLVDVNTAGLKSLAAELTPSGVHVFLFPCNLTNRKAVSAAVAAAINQAGGIDLLINNAGVAYYGPTDQMTQTQWDWLMTVNLLAPIQITHELLPTLLQRPDTHIVNMCSISGLVAGGRFSAYHTSKFGLIGFTESLRAEYGRRGLGVTAICPGPVSTSLYEAAASGRTDQKVPSPPKWMCASPERVATITLKAILKDKRQVLITPTAHALFQLKRFAPWLLDFVNRFSRKGRRKRKLAQQAAETQQRRAA
jgi:short-subunit dehydrogenase